MDSALAPGTELTRRWIRGRYAYARYVVEHSDGRQLAEVQGGVLGHLKHISTATSHYRCFSRSLLRKPTIVAMENNSQTVVAEAALGRSRAITLPIENATLTCTTRDMGSTRAKRLTASMSVVDNDEDEILVIEWLEANTISRPFGLGRATIGESRYEDERLLVVVCLAFHLFAVLLSPGGA